MLCETTHGSNELEMIDEIGSALHNAKELVTNGLWKNSLFKNGNAE